MRVLIADDSAMTRHMLQHAVEKLGHDCLVAEDGTQAWELFQAGGADVIISDWLMPGLEGPELCRHVRAHTPEAIRKGQPPYTYFILLTVLEEKQYALAGMEAGADDYLAKPLDLGDLQVRLIAASRVTTLHRQLAQRDAEREQTLARREVLLRLARRFAAEGNLAQLLTELLAAAVATLGGADGALTRWDEQRGVLVPVRDTRFPQVRDMVLGLGQGVGGRAAAHRAPVVINDYQRECGGAVPWAAPDVRAALAAPLLHEGRLLGTLSVMSYDPEKRFTPEDAAELELVASVGAAAVVGLERARLEGVLLAVRTMEHELNNKLTLTVGWSELIARDAALPPSLQQPAAEAMRGARAASEILQQLHRITRVQETNWGPRAGSTIDLTRSTTAADADGS